MSKLGLTRREANEFIVYWLPPMQDLTVTERTGFTVVEWGGAAAR